MVAFNPPLFAVEKNTASVALGVNATASTSNNGTGSPIGSGSCSITITEPCIVLAYVGVYCPGNVFQTTSFGGSPGTWARRAVVNNSSDSMQVEEYWAYIATPGTYTIDVSWTVSGSGFTGNSNVAQFVLGLVAIQGMASTTSPFDTNASLPGTYNSSASAVNNSNTVGGQTYKTTGTNSILMMCQFALSNSSASTVPGTTGVPGTQDISVLNGSGHLQMLVAHTIYTTAQSTSLTVSTAVAQSTWGVIVDAID